jgi:hypothetical protein
MEMSNNEIHVLRLRIQLIIFFLFTFSDALVLEDVARENDLIYV